MTIELRNKLLAQSLLAISQVALPLLTYPIITRALGAGGLGTVNFVDALVQTFLVLASLGIPLYGIREIAGRKDAVPEQSKTFLEIFLLQLWILIPAIAGLWLVGTISGVQKDFLLTGSIALAGSALGCDWYFQGRNNFLYIALRTVGIRVITIILIWLLIHSDKDALLYYALLTGSVLLTMILNLVLIFPTTGFKVKGLYPFQHFRRMNWIFVCYLMATLYAVIDSLMLGWMSDPDAVGFYSFGYRIVRMSAMLVPTLGIVFIPRISFHHAQENFEKVKEQIRTSQLLVYFICIPLSFCFLLMAPEIVAVLSGPGFRPSVEVLEILSPLPLLVALSHLAGTQILVSVKREKVYALMLAAGLIMDIILNILLIPQLLEKGAAISNLVAETIVTLAGFIYLFRNGWMGMQSKEFLLLMLSSLVLLPLLFILRLFGLSPLVIILVAIPVAGLIYVAIQVLLVKDSFLVKWRRSSLP